MVSIVNFDLVRNCKLNLVIARGILKQISQTFNAKIELSLTGQAMRVTSDYETCQDILKLIIHTVSNIRSSALDFPAELRPKLRSSSPLKELDSILDQIMKSTNTIIKKGAEPAVTREVSAALWCLCLPLSLD